MKLPSTLDLKRRFGTAPPEGDDADEVDGDGYEYEYVYLDEDDPAWADDDRDLEYADLAVDAGGLADAVVRSDADDGPWDPEDEWEDDDDLPGAPAVDPRIAARRDDVAQARRRRLRNRLIALGILLAVVLTAGALTRSAALDVDEIQVTGHERSDAAALAAATGIVPGTPLLGLDLDRALAGVRAQPWVLDATVDRSWSGTVSIAVVERTPVATINAGAGGWLLVDGDRRIVASSPNPPDLPVVEGVGGGAVGDELDPSAQGAVEVARALTPTLRSRVAVVDGTDPDAIMLTLQPTGSVRFGPATEIDERLRSLQTVFAQVDLVCLATIDLRVPDAPVLTRVPACA